MQSNQNFDDNMLCVGELKSAYGIKGWLWIYSYTDPVDTLFKYQPWLYFDQSQVKQLKAASWRKQGKGWIVKLDCVDDRTIAETFVNTKLYIPKDSLPSLSDNEFYWSELIGMRVINDSGVFLGVVSEMSETAAHQMIHVSHCKDSVDENDRMIPWHDQTVISVDRQDSQIQVLWDVDY